MKKFGLLLVAFFCGMMAFAAEFPDFSQPETWKKAAWRKSVYIRGEKGVLKIDPLCRAAGHGVQKPSP